ncbi:hypothetical protein PYX07_20335 [Pseudomonas aeruginosa]|nr:hypothetical protein [Pseudomonas aeruginosa]
MHTLKLRPTDAVIAQKRCANVLSDHHTYVFLVAGVDPVLFISTLADILNIAPESSKSANMGVGDIGEVDK